MSVYQGGRNAMIKFRGCNILWWKPLENKENFGDFLSIYLVDKLFETPKLNADIYQLIGSVISKEKIARNLEISKSQISPKIVYWGCGIRNAETIAEHLLKDVQFTAVRGVITKNTLKLDENIPLGDPALILPIIYSPRKSTITNNRIIFVPHISDCLKHSVDDLIKKSQADLVISPIIDSSLEAVEHFIDDICSSKFVLCGSLHSAIVACAYEIPFCYFGSGHIDLPIKWDDFSSSINIKTVFARNREKAEEIYLSFIKNRYRIPNLKQLLRAAPFILKKNIEAKI